MTEQADDRIDELIALAALGELSEAEELELDALLAGNAELEREVDGAMEAAAMMQGALAEPPPASLKASVLGAIATTTQSAPAEPDLDDRPVEPSPVIDLAERRRGRWLPALSAAAALVLLAGAAVVFTRNDSGPGDDRVAAEVENVVAADDAVARTLDGTLDGTVTVVYSPGEAALVIDGEGLPVLDENRAFVLWFVGEDSATPVQIFRPDASGDVLLRVDDVDPTDFVLGITEEDAAGAETPTLPILADA